MPTTRSQRKPAKEAVPKPYKKADALPDVSKMRNTRSQAKAAKEAVPEKPKPLNKTDAKVPHPGVSNLNGPAGPSHAHRSRKTQLVLADDKERHRALQWFRRAPVFRIRGVHLADFLERGKNTKEGKRLAEEQAGRMADWAADAGSMIVCDEDGEVLACAFAWCFGGEVLREKGDKIDFKNAPFYPGPEGRTLADVVEKDILSADGKKVLKRKTYYDGFTESQIRDYHVVLQEVSALVDPVANARDMRHPDDAFMSYPAEREGVYPNGFTHERTGVKHYVHGWPMQGHPNGILYPSADLARGCLANLTAQHYFDVTAPLSNGVRERFKVSFPEYFEKYDAAFKAGQFVMSDPGPFLGRALVWKLQVHPHQDGLDEGPAGIFPSGDFEGGELLLPDLKMKLAYRPRDLVFLMAGHLYHCVSRWEPKVAAKDITPGRAGSVFFFPKKSYERLVGKEPLWNIKTISGTVPY